MELPDLLLFVDPASGTSFEAGRGWSAGPVGDTSAVFEFFDEEDEVTARWVVQQFPVDGDSSRAAEQLVAGLTAVAGSVEEDWSGLIDEAEMRSVVLHLPDGVPGQELLPGVTDLLAHHTVVIAGEKLLLISGFAPWADQEVRRTEFDTMLMSMRFGTGALTVPALGLSLEAPEGWLAELSEDTLRLYGPESGNRRPTFTLRQGEPDKPGEDWFEWFRTAAIQRVADTAEGFDMVDVDHYVLSSQAAVTALWYHRSEAGPTSQLQAYVWANSHRMLVVDAATAREDQDQDFPLFDALLRSLRLLPR